MNEWFKRTAQRISHLVGTPLAFTAAVFAVLLWACSGFLFSFSDTWQLIINTSTTIITFLMVFLIQSTQNREGREIRAKLDDLILYTKGADNQLVESDQLTDEQLERLEERFRRLAKVLGKEDNHDGAPEETRRQRRRSKTRQTTKSR